MENNNQKKEALSIPERRLLLLYTVLFIYAVYQLYSPTSYTATGDIYLEPEASVTMILFYIVAVFTPMWGGLVLKQKNSLASNLLYFCLGLPTLMLYGAIAMLLFSYQ